MMGYTVGEIFRSILYAIIYGGITAVFFSLISSLIAGLSEGVAHSVRRIAESCKAIAKGGGSKEKNTGRRAIAASMAVLRSIFSSLCRFMKIIVFSLGFSVLSFLTLDGELRLYMLIFSFASFYLLNFTFSEIFKRLFTLFFRVFFKIVFLPILFILGVIMKIRNRKAYIITLKN